MIRGKATREEEIWEGDFPETSRIVRAIREQKELKKEVFIRKLDTRKRFWLKIKFKLAFTFCLIRRSVRKEGGGSKQ